MVTKQQMEEYRRMANKFLDLFYNPEKGITGAQIRVVLDNIVEEDDV